MKLNNFFKLEERGSNVRREIAAGLTTFMTMAYVLVVQPAAIVGFGPQQTFTDIDGLVISKSALLVMCALVSGLITLFMGLYANLPVALSTAMGGNFILGGLVQSGEFSFGGIMALLLISGTLFILMTLFGIRKVIVKMIPKNLKIGMSIAIGFFIAYLGFKNTGLATFEGGLGIGDLKQPVVLLTLIAITLIGILTAYKVKGAILIGIVAATIIGIPMGVTQIPPAIVSIPSGADLGNVFFSYNFKSLFAHVPTALVWIFIVFIGDFFGTLSCLLAVGAQTDMLDEDGNFPNIEKPFLVDSIGTVLGSATGCTTISTFIESTTGIAVGGRTGLTNVITALMFFLSFLFAPLFLMIPDSATGAALIFVGFMMLSSFTKLDFSDFKGSFGALLLILITAFTGQVGKAISIAFIADVLIKVVTGDYKKVHWGMYILCIPLILFLVL